jgi:hypothetical protein
MSQASDHLQEMLQLTQGRHMIRAHQLKKMLSLQNAMNAKVNPDWIHACYPWLRAALVVDAQAIEHYGWKWWKKQTTDHAQFAMELVDIWHFTLSHVILAEGSEAAAATAIIEQNTVTYAR